MRKTLCTRGRGGCYDEMDNFKKEEVKFRGTAKMQKLVESLVAKDIANSKSHIIRMSVKNNIDYIQERLKGQKYIRDFIEYMNEDIE